MGTDAGIHRLRNLQRLPLRRAVARHVFVVDLGGQFDDRPRVDPLPEAEVEFDAGQDLQVPSDLHLARCRLRRERNRGHQKERTQHD